MYHSPDQVTVHFSTNYLAPFLVTDVRSSAFNSRKFCSSEANIIRTSYRTFPANF